MDDRDNNDLTLLLLLFLLGDERDDPFFFEEAYELFTDINQVDSRYRRLFERLRFSSRGRYRSYRRGTVDRSEISFLVGSEFQRLSNDLEQRVEAQDLAATGVPHDLASIVWALTQGLDLNEVPLIRYLPLRIYVADSLDDETASRIDGALKRLADDLGLRVAAEYPEEKGSWFKWTWFKTKELATSEEVKELGAKLEQALGLKHLEHPISELTKNHSESAAALIKSLDGVSEACLQAGALLVVKTTLNGEPKIAVRTLTADELRLIEKNPSMLLRNPREALEMLQHRSPGLDDDHRSG